MKTRRFPSAALQFSVGSLLYTLAVLGFVNNGGLGRVYPLILCPYSLVVYYVNRLLFRRERSASVPAAVNLLLLLAGTVLTALTDGLGGTHWFFTALFFALCTLSGMHLARHAADLHTLLLALDGSVLLLLTALLLVNTASLSLWAILPAALAVGASLSGVIVFRSGGERNGANLLSVILVLAVTALAAAALFSLMRGAGLGLIALWRALVSLLGRLVRILWRFVLFLLSLFPVSSAEYLEYVEPLPAALPGEVSEVQTQPGIVFFLIVLLLLAGGAYFLLRFLHRIRLGSTRIGAEEASAQRQSIPLREALRRYLSARRERIRLRRYLRRHKNEPYILFCRLAELLHRTELRRKGGETPADFLARLAGISGNAAVSEKLLALTEPVNRSLYACAPHAGSAEYGDAARLRRAVRRLRRSHVLREWKKRLAARRSKPQTQIPKIYNKTKKHLNGDEM